MKLLKTEITPLINDSIYVDLRQQPFLSSPFHDKPSFHSHPELELTFIVEGYGKRIIGNNVEPFESGDMVFIGSNVPHIWLSDPVFYEKGTPLQSKVIVTYFNHKTFLQIFDSLKEFRGIREMIRQSSKGIRIFGETKNDIANKLMALSDKHGFEKVEGLLHIMNLISVSPEKSFIINSEPDHYDDLYPDRLIDVLKFIKDHLHEPVSLRNVADVACMTEQSFCRFFKKRTKKTFSEFLGELRISSAREMLIQTDKSIADIAYQCGYSSSSHFSKVFKEHCGISPLRYKATGNMNEDAL